MRVLITRYSVTKDDNGQQIKQYVTGKQTKQTRGSPGHKYTVRVQSSLNFQIFLFLQWDLLNNI